MEWLVTTKGNFHLLSVNSIHKVTFLGLFILAILENIVTSLDAYDDHYRYTFCWFGGSLETLWGHDGWHTSKIHKKFIFRWKNIISIALTISHTCLYVEKNLKISIMAWQQIPNFAYDGLFYLISWLLMMEIGPLF